MKKHSRAKENTTTNTQAVCMYAQIAVNYYMTDTHVSVAVGGQTGYSGPGAEVTDTQ